MDMFGCGSPTAVLKFKAISKLGIGFKTFFYSIKQYFNRTFLETLLIFKKKKYLKKNKDDL